MDVFEAIEKRYSVRGYKPDAVEDDKLQQVLEAARRAPTAANKQPFRMLVVHTGGREEDLARVYPRRWLSQAPLVIAFVAVPGEAWRRMDEILLASTMHDVCPVIALDGAPVGEGRPGPVGQRLREAYLARIAAGDDAVRG